MSSLPYGWSIWDAPDITSGRPNTASARSPFRVENTEEVRLAFTGSSKRPRLTCGYCGSADQFDSPAAAEEWFTDHPCVLADESTVAFIDPFIDPQESSVRLAA